MLSVLLGLTLVFSQALWGEQNLVTYVSYTERLGEFDGNCKEGEIERVMDLDEIAKVQKIQERRLVKKGFSEEEAAEFSRIGVVSEDQYLIWLRDAVYFPGKIPGTYDRLVWKTRLDNPYTGIAVMPILPTGEIVLILTFRHATRSWEFELPRGGVNLGEILELAALREVKEETGLIASSLIFLGEMAPDTGILSSVIPVYMAKIDGSEASTPEYSEAIEGIFNFTKEEIHKGLIQGFLEVTIQGKIKRAALRDPFLTFALLQAEIKK